MKKFEEGKRANFLTQNNLFRRFCNDRKKTVCFSAFPWQKSLYVYNLPLKVLKCNALHTGTFTVEPLQALLFICNRSCFLDVKASPSGLSIFLLLPPSDR